MKNYHHGNALNQYMLVWTKKGNKQTNKKRKKEDENDTKPSQRTKVIITYRLNFSERDSIELTASVSALL